MQAIAAMEKLHRHMTAWRCLHQAQQLLPGVSLAAAMACLTPELAAADPTDARPDTAQGTQQRDALVKAAGGQQPARHILAKATMLLAAAIAELTAPPSMQQEASAVLNGRRLSASPACSSDMEVECEPPPPPHLEPLSSCLAAAGCDDGGPAVAKRQRLSGDENAAPPDSQLQTQQEQDFQPPLPQVPPPQPPQMPGPLLGGQLQPQPLLQAAQQQWQQAQQQWFQQPPLQFMLPQLSAQAWQPQLPNQQQNDLQAWFQPMSCPEAAWGVAGWPAAAMAPPSVFARAEAAPAAFAKSLAPRAPLVAREPEACLGGAAPAALSAFAALLEAAAPAALPAPAARVGSAASAALPARTLPLAPAASAALVAPAARLASAASSALAAPAARLASAASSALPAPTGPQAPAASAATMIAAASAASAALPAPAAPLDPAAQLKVTGRSSCGPGPAALRSPSQPEMEAPHADALPCRAIAPTWATHECATLQDEETDLCLAARLRDCHWMPLAVVASDPALSQFFKGDTSAARSFVGRRRKLFSLGGEGGETVELTTGESPTARQTWDGWAGVRKLQASALPPPDPRPRPDCRLLQAPAGVLAVCKHPGGLRAAAGPPLPGAYGHRRWAAAGDPCADFPAPHLSSQAAWGPPPAQAPLRLTRRHAALAPCAAATPHSGPPCTCTPIPPPAYLPPPPPPPAWQAKGLARESLFDIFDVEGPLAGTALTTLKLYAKALCMRERQFCEQYFRFALQVREEAPGMGPVPTR